MDDTAYVAVHVPVLQGEIRIRILVHLRQGCKQPLGPLNQGNVRMDVFVTQILRM